MFYMNLKDNKVKFKHYTGITPEIFDIIFGHLDSFVVGKKGKMQKQGQLPQRRWKKHDKSLKYYKNTYRKNHWTYKKYIYNSGRTTKNPNGKVPIRRSQCNYKCRMLMLNIFKDNVQNTKLLSFVYLFYKLTAKSIIIILNIEFFNFSLTDTINKMSLCEEIKNSKSSDEDIAVMYNAIDEILHSSPDILSNFEDKFSCIDEQIKKAEEGTKYVKIFNGQMDLCLNKMKTTLGKWIFTPNGSNTENDDNSDTSDISIIDVPSTDVSTSCNVASKNVSNFHYGKNISHLKLLSAQNSNEISSEVIPVKKVMPAAPKLPPIGAKVIKPALEPGNQVYSMLTSVTGKWQFGIVLEVVESKSCIKKYKVKIEKNPSRKMIRKPLGGKPSIRVFNGTELAYTLRPNVILPVGTRVLAKYREDPCANTPVESRAFYDSLYVGIIAEPPKSMNSFKYLIFFDDGYAQYSPIEEVFLVCESSRNVWEDVHEQARNFIKEYLNQYPERPMVKLQRGQSVRTEYKGEWLSTKVVSVHGSLAKVVFDSDNRIEWIYRGSTRLGPLYNKFQKKEEHPSGRVRRQGLTSAFNSQRLPYVEYTFSNDDKVEESDKQSSEEQRSTSRNVARKSSSKPAKTIPDEKNIEATVDNGTVERNLVNIPMLPSYKFHKRCSPLCLKNRPNPDEFKGTNLLEIPTYSSWRREIVKDRPGKKKLVYYRGPCGRRLRSIEEVNLYLIATNSPLTIDMFCFDSYVQTFQNYVPGKVLMQINDISYGKENVLIPCINTISQEKPTYLEYSKQRIPCKDVALNLDSDFLSCCDCEDNCQDSSKCSCQQLTIEATKLITGEADPYAHYVHRRLQDQIFTGLYECNEKCKCDKRCMNRLAQNGLRQRLQLFKTAKKGWGLRILNDLPKGAFICIYTGLLLTEQVANADGRKYGDEYMAELDYIETVENQIKEGYESDLPESEKYDHSEPDDGACSDSDSSFNGNVPGGSDSDENFAAGSNKIFTRKHKKSISHNTKEENTDITEVKDEDLRSEVKDEDLRSEVKDEELPDLEGTIKMPFAPISVRPLSPETAEKLKMHKVARRPRLNVDTENSDSDSEEEVEVGYTQSNNSDSETKDSLEGEEIHVINFNDTCTLKGTSKVKHSNSFKHSNSSVPSKKTIMPSDDYAENKVSARSYFGDEYCYVMDAKNTGNIGRYLNHSCCPNVFVQNIFVDTHDIRFPWVAFFAGQNIKAGEELTWDYNYEIGSVKDRELYCYCNSVNCRGRLL
ncbi:Histone-lysine N-methyltransferase SETDB1 [Nymphon striatum]|nr:Histone-lysine N-methyltransferase SETDB1 [Nymphon striatum]